MTPPQPHVQRSWLVAGAVLLFAVHAGLVFHSIPPQAVFSTQPLRGTSYDRHYGQVIRVATALQTLGRSWVYDVQLFAGQPEGTVGDLDSKAWEVWTFALCRLGVRPATAFNTFVLGLMLLGPAIVGLGGLCFGLAPATALLATALAVLLWFFDSYLHWLWFSGMISWAGASAVAALTVGLFQRWLRAPRILTVMLCGVTLGLAVLLHAAATLTVLPPMILAYALQYKQLKRNERVAPILMIVVVVLINLHWLPSLIEHRHYVATSDSNALSGVWTLLCDLANLRCPEGSSGGLGTRTGLRILCSLIAVGWMVLQRGDRAARGGLLRFSIAWTYGLAFLGPLVPGLASVDPYQQLAPAMLMTTVPAAGFLSALVMSHPLRNVGALTRWLVVVLSLVLARELTAAELVYFLPNLTPEPKIYPDGAKSPLSQFGYMWAPNLPSALYFGVPHDDYAVEEVAHQVRRFAPPKARVLVENALLAERLAWRDGFEVIGGESRRWLQHVDASYFVSPRDLSDVEHYLKTYAIDYVVVGLPVFQDTSSLKQLAKTSGQHIYQSRTHHDRILSGGGSIEAQTNVLEIRNSSASEELVLSYHWHPALRCKPACRVTRRDVEGDRVGFIAIPAPHPRDLTVWNSYAFE